MLLVKYCVGKPARSAMHVTICRHCAPSRLTAQQCLIKNSFKRGDVEWVVRACMVGRILVGNQGRQPVCLPCLLCLYTLALCPGVVLWVDHTQHGTLKRRPIITGCEGVASCRPVPQHPILDALTLISAPPCVDKLLSRK
jgi:hypothetical protein